MCDSWLKMLPQISYFNNILYFCRGDVLKALKIAQKVKLIIE